MKQPEPGEVVTDGKSVTIGAPVVEAITGPDLASTELAEPDHHDDDEEGEE